MFIGARLLKTIFLVNAHRSHSPIGAFAPSVTALILQPVFLHLGEENDNHRPMFSEQIELKAFEVDENQLIVRG